MNTYVVVELIRIKTKTRIHLFWLYFSSDEDTILEDFRQVVENMGEGWEGELHHVPEETFSALELEKQF